MRFSFVLIFSILFYSVGLGQKKYATTSKKAIKYYEQAITSFNKRDYFLVKQNLDKAIKKDPDFIDAYLLRAELFRINNASQLEIDNLESAVAINPDYFPYVYYNLGIAQMNFGLYNKASISFNAFLKQQKARESSKTKAIDFIKRCNYAQSLIENPVDFVPISLGSNINTNNDQYWPSLSIDGKTLIYSVLLVDSTNKTVVGNFAHQEDFFISEKNNDGWTKGKPLGPPINTPGNEGALKISADGNSIVFTACNRSDGYGQCDIYFAHKTAKGWSNASNAGRIVNSKYSDKQPCLSADQRILYFSSNRPGGIGGMDIWYCERDEKGFWLKPKNMGAEINTSQDEESPFIHPDNQTFYFSSDGHWGLGMKDIFYTEKKDSAKWMKPVNIGYPINTYQDEIGLFVDNSGETAFFSSNYNDSSRNIYQFTLPERAKPLSVSYLSGKIYDFETNKPLNAKIELLNSVLGSKVMQVYSDKDDGKFLICLPSGNQYTLNVSCNNYLFNSSCFNLSEKNTYSDPYKQDIGLHAVKINEKIVLQNIFYESDSFELMEASNAELLKIKEYILNNPEWMFEIGGHTDQSGSVEYNMELSEKRAKMVYDYLINENINIKNISYKGYGELQPINDKNLSDKNAKNRRTELKIIGRVNK